MSTIIILGKVNNLRKNGNACMENVPVMKYTISFWETADSSVNMKGRVLPMLVSTHTASKYLHPLIYILLLWCRLSYYKSRFFQVRSRLSWSSSSWIARVLWRNYSLKPRAETYHESKRHVLLHEHYERREFRFRSFRKADWGQIDEFQRSDRK